MTVQDVRNTTLDLASDRDPWDRQPGETPKKYGQFCTYRDMGRTRTMSKVAETLALSAGYVRTVGAAMRWVERAEAWDLDRDRQHQAMWLDERRKAAENDARLLSGVLSKVVGRLATMKPEELTVGDFTRLLDVTMRHRRTLFGDPQTTVAITGPGGDPLQVQLAEFAEMGAEQRRHAIEEMVAALQRRSEAAAGVDDDE